jgi:hypothetical protein
MGLECPACAVDAKLSVPLPPPPLLYTLPMPRRLETSQLMNCSRVWRALYQVPPTKTNARTRCASSWPRVPLLVAYPTSRGDQTRVAVQKGNATPPSTMYACDKRDQVSRSMRVWVTGAISVVRCMWPKGVSYLSCGVDIPLCICIYTMSRTSRHHDLLCRSVRSGWLAG